MPKRRAISVDIETGQRYKLVRWEQGHKQCRAAYLFGWQEIMLNDDCPLHPDLDAQPKIVQEWYENGRLDAANVKYYATQNNLTVPFWGTVSKCPEEIARLINGAFWNTGNPRPTEHIV